MVRSKRFPAKLNHLVGAGVVASALLLAPVSFATPLVDAIRAQDTSKALQLVEEQEVDVNHRHADGSTALMWAVHYNDMELIQALLEAGADVSASNEYGSSAILEAMLNNNTDALRLLLEYGADPDWENPEGETPLMLAARTGNLEAAQLLIKHGADVNARESWGGQSALMWATAQSQAEMVKYLISEGADVNARSKARLWDRRITSEPRPKDMNKGGFTPLHYAARQGCLECARHLLAAGADIDATDPDRVTPLNLALINLHFDMAALLIESGAHVDKWDLFGRTPLYLAVDMNTLPETGRADLPSTDSHSGLDIVRMLLTRGANPNAQLKMRPPYRNAVADRRADHILSYGATPLLRAAKASDNVVIRELLDHGAHVDLPNWMGVTPFMAAAGLGRTESPTRGTHQTQEQAIKTLEILLEAGADINKRTRKYKGKWAEMEDERDFFRDIPSDGQTALHGAAKLGWNQVIEFLVARGAEMQVADKHGRTALDLAYGRYEPAFLLAPPEPLEATVALLERLCMESGDCSLPEGEVNSGP